MQGNTAIFELFEFRVLVFWGHGVQRFLYGRDYWFMARGDSRAWASEELERGVTVGLSIDLCDDRQKAG